MKNTQAATEHPSTGATTARSFCAAAALATLLLERLQGAALERGITVLRADFLAENEAARALIARVGFDAPVYETGVGSVRSDLTRLTGPAAAPLQ